LSGATCVNIVESEFLELSGIQHLQASSDQSDTDYDGLLMLGVSVSVILFPAGLSWLWHAHKVWRYAIFTTAAPNSALESDKMLVFGKRLNAKVHLVAAEPNLSCQLNVYRKITSEAFLSH
jgi:hypothetical protein